MFHQIIKIKIKALSKFLTKTKPCLVMSKVMITVAVAVVAFNQ